MRSGADDGADRIFVLAADRIGLTLVQQILAAAGYTDVIASDDPAEALRVCAADAADLVIVELDLLEAVAAAAPPGLPVLAMIPDETPEAAPRALSLAADDVLTQPLDVTDVLVRVRTRLALRRLTEEREHEALRCLALAAEYRDETSADHLAGVARLAGAIARELGMSERFAAILEAAAPLHDLGKVALPDAVLLKQGSLTDAEMEVVRGHCAIGAQILAGGTSPALALAREIAGGHHERWDGAGYPEGLVGEAIPLSARIVAVADVYDTLTRDRPYRRAWAEPAARGAIVASAGREFDPEVVAAFERTLG